MARLNATAVLWYWEAEAPPHRVERPVTGAPGADELRELCDDHFLILTAPEVMVARYGFRLKSDAEMFKSRFGGTTLHSVTPKTVGFGPSFTDPPRPKGLRTPHAALDLGVDHRFEAAVAHLAHVRQLAASITDADRRELLSLMHGLAGIIAGLNGEIAPSSFVERIDAARARLRVMGEAPTRAEREALATDLMRIAGDYVVERVANAHRDRNIVRTWRYEYETPEAREHFHSDTRMASDIFRTAPWREFPLYL